MQDYSVDLPSTQGSRMQDVENEGNEKEETPKPQLHLHLALFGLVTSQYR